MKTIPFPIRTAVIAAAMVVPALALEAPEDNAPPPPVPASDTLPEIKLPPDNRVKPAADVAFLGVVSGDIPDMLADHLGLKSGQGVVIRSLVPEGPAATAGVAINDVITRVGGQPVGSPAEVSKEISSHKPGDKISLDLIHKGRPGTLDVTLGLRPAEMAAAEPHTLNQLDLEGFPKELADRLREALEGNVGKLDLSDEDAQVPPHLGNAMKDLRKRMQDAIAPNVLIAPDAGAGANGQAHAQATVRMKDNDGSVEVRSKDGAKEVTVRDNQDNVTWSGPWDTAQDRAAAPEKVRQRVEALHVDDSFKGGGLRLQMRGAGEPDN